MKHFLIFLFLILPPLAFCQDTILAVNGEEFSGKITEITLDEVLFIQEGESVSFPLNKVFIIKYENGTREVYAEHLNYPDGKKSLSRSEAIKLGIIDANKFHSGNEPLYYTAGGTCLSAPVGCAMVIGYAVIKPKPIITSTSDPELINNVYYQSAYIKQAQKNKTKMALKGFGISLGIQLAIVVGMITLSGGL